MMVKRYIARLFKENNQLAGTEITEEEYFELQEQQDAPFYLYKEDINYDNSKYFKFDLTSIKDEDIPNLLAMLQHQSLKKSEKYLRLFYILVILSLIISAVIFVILIFS